jgi:hypothetical protein
MGAHSHHATVSMASANNCRAIKKSRTQTTKRAINMDIKSLEDAAA